MRNLWIVILLAATPAWGAGANGPEVRANGETLIGRWAGPDGRIAEFRGIPFAAPPVGDARGRAPAPHRPREGPQVATEFAPGCMQGPGGVDWYVRVAAAFGHGPEAVGRPDGLSEDCLYLNIWTPAPGRDTGLPVMVFVHGGSNAGGWSYEPNYVGAALAGRGVVVVTVAYRLGVFGFFTHPALLEGADGPVANFGLLDIRAAFAWVQDHIGAFGGDPSNVTAFGESAGAFDLVDLLLDDLAAAAGAKPPFRRLISQSLGGSLVDRQTLEGEQQTGVLLIDTLGPGAGVDADALRAIPAEKLLEAAAGLPDGHYFDAVIDGETLRRHPMESLARAQFEGVALIAGTNSDEWYMYLAEDTSADDLDRWLEENAPANRDALRALVADEADPRAALDRLRTARNMLCPSRLLARRINETGGRAWVYRFTRRRPGPGGERLGAYHGTELPYVFDTHDDWLPTQEADRRLTGAVMDYWVQFARSGDPNRQGRPAWPLHTDRDPAVMELGDEVRQRPSSTEEMCRLLAPEPVPETEGQ